MKIIIILRSILRIKLCGVVGENLGLMKTIKRIIPYVGRKTIHHCTVYLKSVPNDNHKQFP